MATDKSGMGIPLPADSTKISDFPKVARDGFEKVAEVLAGDVLPAGMARVAEAEVRKSLANADVATLTGAASTAGDIAGGFIGKNSEATWLTHDASGGPTEYAKTRLGLLDLDAADVAGGIIDAEGRQTDLVYGPDGHVTDRVLKLWAVRMDRPMASGLTTTDTRVFWGHSMAWGKTNAATPISDFLAPLLGKPVINQGIGGQLAAQIGARFIADQSYRDAVVYIWPARNDLNKADTSPEKAVYWIRRMVEHLTPIRRKVLIFEEPPWNGETFGSANRTGPNALDAYNNAIKTMFPDYWVPLASWMLTDAAATAAGITFTDADRAAREKGTTPPSFLSDAGHYNTAGNRAAAFRILQEEKNRGWI